MSEYSLGRQPVRVELHKNDYHEVPFYTATIEEDVDLDVPVDEILRNNVVYRDGDELVIDGGKEDVIRIHESNLDLEVVGDLSFYEVWESLPNFDEKTTKTVTYRFSDIVVDQWDLESNKITEPREDPVRISIDVANSARWDDGIPEFDYVSSWRIHGIGMFDPDVDSVITEGNPDDYMWFAALGFGEDGNDVIIEGVTTSDGRDSWYEMRIPKADIEVTGYENHGGDIPDEEPTLDLLLND